MIKNELFVQRKSDKTLSVLILSLEHLCHREEQTSNKKIFNRTRIDEVNVKQRNSTSSWLRQLSLSMGFAVETYILSIDLLDRCLSKLKVRPKLLECLSVACLYIAAKCKEEDEKICITPEFIIECNANCSSKELLRMERLILEKFDWFVNFVTAVDFLQIYFSIVMVKIGDLNIEFDSTYFQDRYLQFEFELSSCFQDDRLSSYRPQILALTLISLEFERQQFEFNFDWLVFINYLQKISKIEIDEFISCRHFLVRRLSTYKVVRLESSDLKFVSQMNKQFHSTIDSSNRPSYADVLCGRSWQTVHSSIN